MEKELRERMEDERRFKKHKQGQNDMRDFLRKQLEEKKDRERMEKLLNDEQAQMWTQDKKNYEQEEYRLQNKIKQINQENARFLQEQAQAKALKA